MSLVVYLAAAVFGSVCFVIFRSRPRSAVPNPLTVSTCAAIVLGSLTFVCAAPVTLAAVNDLTGVPNFGAPLTYGVLTAYSCSLLILLIHWRGGSPDHIRRLALRATAVYAALIVAIVTLFVLADADTERLSDLDTYYATTPFMREMTLLYLLGHTAAMGAMCVVCVKWIREVTGLLRAGLRLILAGALLDVVGFQFTKYTAVVARWTGHDLDFLSTQVAPPMAALAALTFSLGFVLPRLLPAVRAHRDAVDAYRSLGPLWSRIRFASTAPEPPSVRWQLPQDRLRWREVAIHDALLTLAPYFDDQVRESALDTALREGRDAHEARVTAEAAMVADAARRASHRLQPAPAPSTHRLHATEVSGTDGLLELARALDRSTRVTTVPEGTVRATPG
ncbi:hypothetical protein K4B79_15610 [Streptomyces lincolnensis]|uniref:MAB_1171c family putative transporter n=1 Tax=Streptomyces lincolnensis TaxID=1915 RepID=UPI001E561862|nr:MAB_1171c family putative transporter [Streptomyces lincolnensis]MCD7439649.1 hypothetical protein [Streptomyces lincolnensis]